MVTSFTDWEGTCLAHHGIKGQKWGVRRYQNKDGTLTAAGKAHLKTEGGSRKESRQYNKQLRKLNRLEKRADVDLQAKKAKRYATKAKIAGVGALGLGAAALNSHGRTVRGINDDIKAWQATWDAADKESGDALDWLSKHTGKNATLGNEHMMRVAQRAINTMKNATNQKMALKKINTFSTAPVSTKTKVLAGAAAVAGGYAAYSAIRSKIAKNRTTTEGHKKAVAKYKQQYGKMVDRFKDTPYSELLKKQKKGALS